MAEEKRDTDESACAGLQRKAPQKRRLQRKAHYANGLRPKKDERSGCFEDEIRPLSGDAGALHDAFCAGFSEDAHGACERSGGRSEAAH